MKIETKLKIRNLKRTTRDRWYKFLQFILKPLAICCDKIDDKKYKHKCDASNYKLKKIKRLLYKELQRRLMMDEDIYIFYIDYITEEDKSSNFLEMKDLFRNSKYQYLKNYAWYAKNKILKMSDMFDVVKEFNNVDMTVKDITKDEFKSLMTGWTYIEYSKLYKKSERILKISRYKKD